MIFNSFNQLNQSLPREGRLMAIDVGTKRIGIAVSDKDRNIATPKTTIIRKGNIPDFNKIKDLILDNDIKALIIGLPINMDESENEMSQFVRRFAKNLDEFLNNEAKIFLQDERLSSFMAKDDLITAIKGKKNKKKSVIDQMAASLILQSFFLLGK